MAVTTLTPEADLEGLDDADLPAMLAAAFADGDEALQAALEAECHRRDRADKMAAARARAKRKYELLRMEWHDAAVAQFQAAEAYCGGSTMLSRAGEAEGIKEPLTLWAGSEKDAQKWASEELRNFWLETPRLTFYTWLRQRAREKRAELASRDVYESSSDTSSIPPEQAKQGGNMDTEDTDVMPAVQECDHTEDTEVRIPDRAERERRAAMRDEAMNTAAQRAGITRAPRPAANTAIAIPTPAPLTPTRVYAAPIDGAQLLNRGFRYFNHMAKWSSLATQVTGVLYSAHCNARDETTRMPVFLYEPHLCLHAKEGGSGKSWSARLISSLAPDPDRLGEMTKASLVQAVSERHTVIITELDKLVATSGKRCAWLPGIANLMFEFDGATSVMKGGARRKIPLFAPLILDGNDCMFETTGGELLTMFDRCIKLRCVKVPPLPDGTAYHPPRYDSKMRAFAKDLQADLAEWMAQEVKEDLAEHVPDMPKHLGNRVFDLWEPLFIVAERAGGDWPELVRYACEYIESPAALAGAQASGQDDPDARRAKQDAQLDEWGAAGPMLPTRQPAEDDGWDIRDTDLNLDAGVDVEEVLS